MTHRRTSRALGALALGLAVSLTAACGSGDRAAVTRSDPSVSSTRHDGADASFAQDMLAHHAQALAMVDLTAGRPLDPPVRRLADEIRAAQTPEIDTMAGWLTDWDEKVPAAARDHGGSMPGMATGTPGMMSAREMTGLRKASDAAFQDRWLSLMIEHHRGAVAMARTKTHRGRYRPAVDLAGRIIRSQSVEVATMRGLVS